MGLLQYGSNAGRSPTWRSGRAACGSTLTLQWPVPLRMEEPGNIYVNAYKGKVLIFTWVYPPGNPTASPVVFRAKASWLVCKNVCVKERAEGELLIPVGISGGWRGESAEIFDTYAKLVPRPVEDYPFFSLEAYWLEWSRSPDQPRIARISLESTSDRVNFLPEKTSVQWFDDPSELLYSEEIDLAADQSSRRKLVLELPVRAIGDLESWPVGWGGVLSVKISTIKGDRLHYSFPVRFADSR